MDEVILPVLFIVAVPKEICNLIVSARSDSNVPLFVIDTVPLDCCNEIAEPGLLALSVTDTVPELFILKFVERSASIPLVVPIILPLLVIVVELV